MTPRKNPYSCDNCEKNSVEEGQPYLTLEGLKPTYVEPPGWVYGLQMHLCPDCAGTLCKEIRKERVDSLKERIIHQINCYGMSDPEAVTEALMAVADSVLRECVTSHAKVKDCTEMDGGLTQQAMRHMNDERK